MRCAELQARCRSGVQFDAGGDGGIRTLDRALQPYNGLANRRLQPLGHISEAPAGSPFGPMALCMSRSVFARPRPTIRPSRPPAESSRPTPVELRQRRTLFGTAVSQMQDSCNANPVCAPLILRENKQKGAHPIRGAEFSLPECHKPSGKAEMGQSGGISAFVGASIGAMFIWRKGASLAQTRCLVSKVIRSKAGAHWSQVPKNREEEKSGSGPRVRRYGLKRRTGSGRLVPLGLSFWRFYL